MCLTNKENLQVSQPPYTAHNMSLITRNNENLICEVNQITDIKDEMRLEKNMFLRSMLKAVKLAVAVLF